MKDYPARRIGTTKRRPEDLKKLGRQEKSDPIFPDDEIKPIKRIFTCAFLLPLKNSNQYVILTERRCNMKDIMLKIVGKQVTSESEEEQLEF
jgi:hypothetical protein